MFFRAAEKLSPKYRDTVIFKIARILCKYHMKNDREVSWEPPGPLGVFFFGVRRRPKNHPEYPKLTRKTTHALSRLFLGLSGPLPSPILGPRCHFRKPISNSFLCSARPLSDSESLNFTLWTTVIIRQGPPKNSGAVVTRR